MKKLLFISFLSCAIALLAQPYPRPIFVASLSSQNNTENVPATVWAVANGSVIPPSSGGSSPFFVGSGYKILGNTAGYLGLMLTNRATTVTMVVRVATTIDLSWTNTVSGFYYHPSGRVTSTSSNLVTHCQANVPTNIVIRAGWPNTNAFKWIGIVATATTNATGREFWSPATVIYEQ